VLFWINRPQGRLKLCLIYLTGALQKFIKDINGEGEESKPKLEERSSLEEEEEDQEGKTTNSLILK